MRLAPDPSTLRAVVEIVVRGDPERRIERLSARFEDLDDRPSGAAGVGALLAGFGHLGPVLEPGRYVLEVTRGELTTRFDVEVVAGEILTIDPFR